jgi:hypothetical protein
LNTTAKLNSANTFTGLQTIVGDLKADYVLVKNTTPTLTAHLSSKLYVDTALNGKQKTLLAGDNITIKNNTISSTDGITQDTLDLKQDVLSRNSHVNINSLIVSSDIFSIGTIVPGQICCNSLLIDAVDIDTKIANDGITQADLDTKQNTLTSSSNILTSRIYVNDKLVITEHHLLYISKIHINVQE